MKPSHSIFAVLFAVILLSGYSFAQDAVKVDPENYRLEFENDEIRVLRVTLNPGEKGVMHSHPESVVVFLTDGEGKPAFPDGKTQNSKFKAGQVIWSPEVTHRGENIGKEPFEVIQIELKKK